LSRLADPDRPHVPAAAGFHLSQVTEQNLQERRLYENAHALGTGSVGVKKYKTKPI
jgi:hypothetical protein